MGRVIHASTVITIVGAKKIGLFCPAAARFLTSAAHDNPINDVKSLVPNWLEYFTIVMTQRTLRPRWGCPKSS
jgi:hypothetical protein